jgi:hypothetical protein
LAKPLWRVPRGQASADALEGRVEVGGKITHHEGVISPDGQIGDASDMLVREFDYDPDAHAAKLPETGDKYAGYADDVILAQWA